MPEKNENEVELHAWRNMIHRCHNPHNKSYSIYGGREEKPVSVCDEWRAADGGFEAFFAHVGPRPSKDYSLDRLDPWGNYEPGNVAWRTKSEQQHNRRPYRYDMLGPITLHGETLSAEEWERRSGVDSSTIRLRVRQGRTDDEVLHKGRLPRRSAKQNRRIPGLYL